MILVTNDDGVFSPGIQILAKRLKALDEVIIVAPDRERSAAGHSMTLHRPLLIEQVKESVYSVNGTPTDCVNIAVKGLLKETPKLVVSGINKGPNLGDDVTYSGTVAGACTAFAATRRIAVEWRDGRPQGQLSVTNGSVRSVTVARGKGTVEEIGRAHV